MQDLHWWRTLKLTILYLDSKSFIFKLRLRFVILSIRIPFFFIFLGKHQLEFLTYKNHLYLKSLPISIFIYIITDDNKIKKNKKSLIKFCISSKTFNFFTSFFICAFVFFFFLRNLFVLLLVCHLISKLDGMTSSTQVSE